jgi:hypothetical protein
LPPGDEKTPADRLRSWPRSLHQKSAAFMPFPITFLSAFAGSPRWRATTGGEEDHSREKKGNSAMNRKRTGYRYKFNLPMRRPVVFKEGAVHARAWADDLVGGIVNWKVDVVYCLGREPRPWDPCTHDIPAASIVDAVRALYRAHTFICKQKKKSGILSWLLGGVK